VKIKEIHPNIYLVTSKKLKYLTKSFQRMSEFNESPSKKFQGKYFEKKVFNKWFDKKYCRDYYISWEGFNVTDVIVNSFEKKYKNKLDDYELNLFSLIKTIPKKKYSLIGARDKDYGTILHELIHGVFYLNKGYQKKVQEYLFNSDCKSLRRLRKHLKEIGYCNKVMVDELNAYLMAEKKYLNKNKIWNKKLIKISKGLKKLIKQYHPNVFKRGSLGV